MRNLTALAMAICFSALVSAAEDKPQPFKIDFLASGELVNYSSPAYSNAMLKAVLPYFSEFARKLNLPVRVPIRTTQVKSFLPPHLIRRKGQVGESVMLKDGTSFGFWDGHVTGYDSPRSYFHLKDLWLIPTFYGPLNMTKEEAIKFARDAIGKLGYPLEDVLADLEPSVPPLEHYGTNIIPRYHIRWLDPRCGGSSAATEIEVNAYLKTIESIRFNYIVALRRPDPKVTVEPDPLPSNHLWRRMNDRANDINHEYAYRLVPVVFRAVEDWVRKFNLDLPLPVTTNQVRRFYCSNDGGDPYVELTLKNDWYFVYRVNAVTYFRSARCFFESALLPFYVRDFVGTPRLSEEQAITFARQVIAKLGYPPGFAHTDLKPRLQRLAEIKGMPTIPRLCIEWVYPAPGQPRDQWIQVEVDCARGTAEMVRFDDVRLWDKAPDLGVPIDPPTTTHAVPPEKVEKVVVPEPPRIAPPPAEPTPPHARGIPDFGMERPPPTAWTITPFQGVKVGMPIRELLSLCGLPDGDWGVDLGHVLIWDLNDGSWVTIRSKDLSRVDSISHQCPSKHVPAGSHNSPPVPGPGRQ